MARSRAKCERATGARNSCRAQSKPFPTQFHCISASSGLLTLPHILTDTLKMQSCALCEELVPGVITSESVVLTFHSDYSAVQSTNEPLGRPIRGHTSLPAFDLVRQQTIAITLQAMQGWRSRTVQTYQPWTYILTSSQTEYSIPD